MMLVLAGSLHAAIGWSGNIWPNSYTDHTNGLDITVYYQIWKDGVTNLPGQGDSISATIYYKTQSQTSFTSELMTFMNIMELFQIPFSTLVIQSFSIVKDMIPLMQHIPMGQIRMVLVLLMLIIPASTILLPA
jgi:hypothetical protein